MYTNTSIKSFASKLVSILARSPRVLVATHANPDGDALSSLSAIAHLLEARNVPRTLLAHDYDGQYLSHLPHVSEIQRDAAKVSSHGFDVLILVDAHTLRRSHLPSFRNLETTFAIDHHPVEPHPDKMRDTLIHPGRTSTCSIVLELFEHLRISVTPVLANILLCGILTDCEKFKNHATNQHTFEQVGKLIQYGADINLVERFAFRTYSVSALREIGKELTHVLVHHEYNAGILVAEGEKSGLANILKRTQFPQTTLVLKHNPQHRKIEVSLRSPSTNVGELARLLGGGGHDKAAAFRLKGELVEKDGKWSIV